MFLRDRALLPQRRAVGAPRRSRPGQRTFGRTPTSWAWGCVGALPTHPPSGPAPQGRPGDRATAATPCRHPCAARALCPHCMRGSWPTGGPMRGAPTPCVRHAPPPPSYWLERNLEPPLRARRRRRSELAGAPHCPLPLLKFKCHSSLHPHPLDPPVHVHWPADSPARRHCDRRGRLPPPSPPTVVGSASSPTNPTK
jgi:hypothetical protein